MRRPLFSFLAAIVAAVWAAVVLMPGKDFAYDPYRGQAVCMEGEVCSLEPALEGDRQVWRMVVSKLELEGSEGKKLRGALTTRSRVLCILDREPRLVPSARVRVRGRLWPFRTACNEGTFDLRRYYHILRIEFSLRDVAVLEVSGPRDPLAAGLYRLKRRIVGAVDRTFSEKNAPVIKAMLVGEKGLLDEETRELYQGAGVIHILSISGMHMSLIGMGMFHLLSKIPLCPLPARTGLSLLAVFFYGKMIGMGTSPFRAMVMLSLYMTAKVIGRTYDLVTAAGIACVVLLLDQPLFVLHTGFQFSFAAVLSLGILLPALPGRLLKMLAIPLGTLPVYLWTGGTFPLYSPVLNLLVLPLMPLVMLSGGIAAALGSVGADMGATIMAFPAEAILSLYRFLADLSARLPGHELVLGRPGIMQIILYYAMLLALAALLAYIQMPHVRRRIERAGTRDNRERRRMAGLVSGFWLAACLALLSLRIPPSFEMVFLDVGQGDGIYICAGGRHFLIDGGSSSEKDLAGYTLLPFLHCRGVSRLDGVILTHDDIDHSGGLLDFLESAEEGRPRIGIGAIYLPDIAEGARGPRYRQIEELAREEGIPVLSISRGMRIRSGRLDMVCLHPEKGAEYEDANAGSTTLCLRYGPFSALLTGDIEGEGEEDLIRFLREGQGEEDLIRFLREGEGEGAAEDPEVFRVTLLKVPHHGSKNATSKRFLETVHADHAVISAGRNNLYGHPHEELLERLSAAGIPFERTDRSGMVTVREEKGSFCMRTFLGDSCRFIFADVIECVSVFGSRAFRQVGIADDIWCSWGTGGRTNEEA